MAERTQTVLEVRGHTDGFWYIGAGRSIAEGPYRDPGQVLSVASDLLAAEVNWRIDVFDHAGKRLISYSSQQLHAEELHPVRWQNRQHWSALGASEH